MAALAVLVAAAVILTAATKGKLGYSKGVQSDI